MVAELVFKIKAGALVLFLNTSKNALIVYQTFFLSSPNSPSNQCPTNKNAKSSLIDDIDVTKSVRGGVVLKYLQFG